MNEEVMNGGPATEIASATEPVEELIPDRKWEAVEGERMERMMGAKAGWIVMRIAGVLAPFVQEHGLGFLMGADCGYSHIFPHAPRQLRYPDLSFVRKERLSVDEPPDSNLRIVPDLVVEVASPNDLAEDVERRVTDFVRAKVPLIWVIYPNVRSIRVLKHGASAPILFDTDEIDGGDVLPGFKCRVDRLLSSK